MRYTVTYRDPSGALRSEAVDAGSRAEALSVCRGRGIRPVSVAAGGEPPGGAQSDGGRFRAFAVAAAGLIALLVGVVAYISYAPSPRVQRPSAERREGASCPKRAAPSAPVRAWTGAEAPKPMVADAPASSGDSGASARLGEGVVSITATTNKSGSVIERLVMADGTTRSRIHPPRPVFRRASDQVIALCLSAKPGQSMPPLPALDGSLERDFVEAMSEPIEISGEDPPDVRELKAQVIEARAYLKDEIKGGRTTLLEALGEHRRAMERTADAHAMALQELRRIRRDGGSQADADDFVRAVNESFRARGMPELEQGGREPRESRRTRQ